MKFSEMSLTFHLSLKPLLAFREFTHMWMFKSILHLLFGKYLWMTLLLVFLELPGIYTAPPDTFPIAYVTFNTPLPSVRTTHMNFNMTFETCPGTTNPSTINSIFQVNFFYMQLSVFSPGET